MSLRIGDTVKVHYTGKFMDGKIFDSTATREPIMFTIGDDMMIPGFEKAVMEMEVDEKITVEIPAKDAYGEYDEEQLIEVNRKDVFGDKDIKVGDMVHIPTDEGVVELKIHSINDEIVILDGNSELAGKDLIFEIHLLEVMKGDEFGPGSDLSEFEMDDDDFDEGLDIDDTFDVNTL